MIQKSEDLLFNQILTRTFTQYALPDSSTDQYRKITDTIKGTDDTNVMKIVLTGKKNARTYLSIASYSYKAP